MIPWITEMSRIFVICGHYPGNGKEQEDAVRALEAPNRIEQARGTRCEPYTASEIVCLSPELATHIPPSKRGHPPIAPAQLAFTVMLQAYTGASDDEVIEATLMD
jgi:hypothetical protein